jgi:transcription elongation factor Elf1
MEDSAARNVKLLSSLLRDEPLSGDASEDDEIDEIDHEHTDEPVCPYCGHEHSDGDEYHERDDTTRITCTECGQEFESERYVLARYSTSKIDHEAEALAKRRKDEETAARYAACQKFPPGTPVRIKERARGAASARGASGVVANRELSRRNPVVRVEVGDQCYSVFPEDVELLC